MPDMEGVDFLKVAREVQPNSLSLLLSGYSDVQALIGALNIRTVRGFISKPWNNEELFSKIRDAAKEYRVVFQNPKLLQTYSSTIHELEQQIGGFKRLVESLPADKNPEIESADLQDQQDREANSVKDLYTATEATVASRMLGIMNFREADPQRFEILKSLYMNCLDQAFEQRVYSVLHPISANLKEIANELGQVRAGPRDVIELHHSALMAVFEKYHLPRRQVYVTEGRLLVLELMGYLVQFYRRNSVWTWSEENHA